jgi:hypothetical protein
MDVLPNELLTSVVFMGGYGIANHDARIREGASCSCSSRRLL